MKTESLKKTLEKQELSATFAFGAERTKRRYFRHTRRQDTEYVSKEGGEARAPRWPGCEQRQSCAFKKKPRARGDKAR